MTQVSGDTRRPLILLSNDDGVEAAGLSVLAAALRPLAEVLVVAPDGERSATSHSVQISARWAYRRLAGGEYALDGTPADCVYVGVTQLAPRPPDLVVAGINDGYNLGTDVLYSGTVAAAAEGVVLGAPGIALSTDRDADDQTLARAARFGAALVSWVLETGWRPAWTLFNVNVPRGGTGQRFALCSMGTRRYRPAARLRQDWPGQGTIALKRPSSPGTRGAEGEDARALENGVISVCPLRLDWTARDQLALGSPLELDGFESGGEGR